MPDSGAKRIRHRFLSKQMRRMIARHEFALSLSKVLKTIVTSDEIREHLCHVIGIHCGDGKAVFKVGI